MHIPPVSLVICTYNRADLLEILLQSVQEQDADPTLYEVLVIDNRSTDNTPAVCAHYGVRHIVEDQQGLSYARNRGWHEAAGDYLAYIDDDCKLPKSYLSAVINVIRDLHPAAFGGGCFPFYLTPKPRWFMDRYGLSVNQGENMRQMLDHEWLEGLNMIIRRDVVDRLDGFNVSLGMTGKKIAFAEDSDFFMRLHHEYPNAEVYYTPTTYVYHLVRPEKMVFADSIRRQYAGGRDVRRSHLINKDIKAIMRRPRTWLAWLRIPLGFGRALIRCTVGLVHRDRTLYPYWLTLVYEQAGQVAYQLGETLETYRQIAKTITKQHGVE